MKLFQKTSRADSGHPQLQTAADIGNNQPKIRSTYTNFLTTEPQ